jgi:hypothetical protein
MQLGGLWPRGFPCASGFTNWLPCLRPAPSRPTRPSTGPERGKCPSLSHSGCNSNHPRCGSSPQIHSPLTPFCANFVVCLSAFGLLRRCGRRLGVELGTRRYTHTCARAHLRHCTKPINRRHAVGRRAIKPLFDGFGGVRGLAEVHPPVFRGCAQARVWCRAQSPDLPNQPSRSYLCLSSIARSCLSHSHDASGLPVTACT